MYLAAHWGTSGIFNYQARLVLFPLRVLDVLPESSQTQPGWQRLHRPEGVDGVGQDGAELDGDEGEDDAEVEQVLSQHGRQQTEKLSLRIKNQSYLDVEPKHVKQLHS